MWGGGGKGECVCVGGGVRGECVCGGWGVWGGVGGVCL